MTRRSGLALAVSAALAAGCDTTSIFERSEPATEYERYARALGDAGLDSSALGLEWLAASDSALAAPVAVTLPFQEAGHYSRAEARAVAYRVNLEEGHLLNTTVSIEGLPLRLFVDLFRVTGDTADPYRHVATALADTVSGAWMIAHEVRDGGQYLLRLQPELLRDGKYLLRMSVGPTLAFPVEGRDNSAVLSLFGVDRDGGRRRHHGIDIFAPRGTPALAAAVATVRSTEPNNLGGKVVWLSDSRRQQSLYYAHLDSVLVTRGQRVEIGDTIGFVGNTGNARTTRPHLHFGLYRRGRGPVDPWPWVRIVTRAPAALRADTARLGQQGVVRAATGRAVRGALALLRDGPSSAADSIAVANPGTVVRVIAAAGDWYRVLDDEGIAGYIPARQVSPP
ncbi:MAG: peptidoglycan DD-metalloendopeptidase family protein [Gemmatimonadota bacterium]